MKTDKLKPFNELSHSNKLLRLDWFGGAKCNIDEFDNPLIECIFTPFELLDSAAEVRTAIPKKYDQFIAGIAVGYLPALFLGQCFQEGKQLPLDQWLPSEKITFEIDVSDPSAVIECKLPDLGLEQTSTPVVSRFADTANQSCIKELRGNVTHSSNEKVNKKIKYVKTLPLRVIIHEMELIRFYLSNSSHSCKNIFNGAFADENIGTKVINEIHEKKYLDPETAAGRFVYRHGYATVDAPMLGRILLDPTQLALKAAQRVHSKIIADRINSENDWIGYPKTLFPFEGKTKLVLSGRRLKTDAGYIFLAYKIHSCSAPFPYKSLSYCDEFSRGGLPAPPGVPLINTEIRTVIAGADHSAEEIESIGLSKSDEPPSANSILLRVELGEREYIGLSGVPLKREKLRDITHRTEHKFVQEKDGLPNASTGAPTSGDTSARRQSVTEKTFVPSEITEDLYTFISAIKKLRTEKPSWKISPIIVGKGFENDGAQTSYFPVVPCAILKDTMRQFSFIGEDQEKRRRFICVEILANERYFYILEAQRRLRHPLPTDGSSPFKENLPILLLHTPGFTEVQGNDFLEFIKRTVINKTWPNDISLGSFTRDHLFHEPGNQSVENLIRKIRILVQRNSHVA